MSTLAMSIEGLIIESENLSYTATSLQVGKSTPGLDSALTYMGLESATSLSAEISQEGIVGWIGKRLSSLGRKLTITLNKIYAKITKADDSVKDLIKRAEGGEDVKLPISGPAAAAIITGGLIVVTAITYFSGSAIKGAYDERRANKIENELKKHMEAAKQYRSQAAEAKSKMSEQTKKMRKDQAKLIGKKRRQLNELRNKESKGFLKSLSALFGKLMSALKNASGKITGMFRKTENESYKQTTPKENKEHMKRLSNVSKNISKMFKSFWTWFKANWRGVINALDKVRKMAKEIRIRSGR